MSHPTNIEVRENQDSNTELMNCRTSDIENKSAAPVILTKSDVFLQEEEMKKKFPMRPAGTSVFLQRRLAKGQKYFDSGDYQMAKQKNKLPTSLLAQPTGEAIPTPECVPHPQKKSSLVQFSKKQVITDP